MNILITGIGGTRSIAVLKALRMDGQRHVVVGTDANYFNAGSYQCDKSYILPFVSDSNYLPKLEKVIVDESIDIIFATTEKEVSFLAQHKHHLRQKYDVVVLVPDSEILEICFDKYRTQLYLQQSGFQHIPTIYDGEPADIAAFVAAEGLPLIRKPVFGYGSKGLSLIKTEEELRNTPLDASYVLQRYIANSDDESFYNLELNEYTAEIFINDDATVAGGIIIKRALRNGETIAGYLIKNDAILSHLTKVALATKIKGPINFQFKVLDDEVYIFEINPLFSGTTAVRAHLGFNSVALATDSFVNHNHRRIAQDGLTTQYFLRYLEEVFVTPEDIQTLRNEKYIVNGR